MDAERIIAGQDCFEQFLAGKRLFIEKSVEDILNLIHEREQIKYENLRMIDYNESKAQTRLMGIERIEGYFNPSIERIKNNVHKELNTFESERRMEVVSCWRDISRLRGDLREVMGEFAQEKRKQDLLRGGK